MRHEVAMGIDRMKMLEERLQEAKAREARVVAEAEEDRRRALGAVEVRVCAYVYLTRHYWRIRVMRVCRVCVRCLGWKELILVTNMHSPGVAALQETAARREGELRQANEALLAELREARAKGEEVAARETTCECLPTWVVYVCVNSDADALSACLFACLLVYVRIDSDGASSYPPCTWSHPMYDSASDAGGGVGRGAGAAG